MADYTKTISEVYLTQLQQEIEAEPLITVQLDSMQHTVADGSLILHFNDVLPASDEAALDAVLAAHIPYTTILVKLHDAQAWARDEMEYWQEVIIKEGVVQAGMARDVSLATKDAAILGWLGNLYALEDELGNITPIATFLEQSRLDQMRNNVRAYLGLPLLWDASVAYVAGDTAHLAGVNYVALAANTNDAPPSANWQVV
jgi:hypothetical protein